MNRINNWIDELLQNRVGSHVLFWITLVLISTGMSSLNFGDMRDHLINNVVLLPVQLVASYALVYWQVPNLLLRKKYLRFLGSLILAAYLLCTLARLAIIYVAEPFTRDNFIQETPYEVLTDPVYLFIVYLPAIYLYAIILIIAKTLKERFQYKHQVQVLQKEKAMTELKFLKAQVHPHFLFNTLNNLYALTLEKSDAAPEVVVKLSEMLDYMLYQGNEPRVPINKELELIQNYLDLELLRYGEKLDLKFEQDIDDRTVPIAPLLLLSLIENAFKHGASGNLYNPLVHIDLRISGGQLYFQVFNTKATKPKNKANKKGVGSENVKRQLGLIYPDQYQLEINESEETYEVILKVELIQSSTIEQTVSK